MAMTLTQDDIDAIAAAILVTPGNLLATDASGRVDLVDAPNATAVAAIQDTLATSSEITAQDNALRAMIKTIIGARGNFSANGTIYATATIASGSIQSGNYGVTLAFDNQVMVVGGSSSIDFYVRCDVPAGATLSAVVTRVFGEYATVNVYASPDATNWTSVGSTSDYSPDPLEILALTSDASDVVADENGYIYVRFTSGYYGPTSISLDYFAVVVETAISGGGLTAQETRDAMLLAPSEGTPAADSVDAKLDDILLDTSEAIPALFAASGVAVTVISAVAGDTITVRVADTWLFTVPVSPADLSDYETVALVVKRSDGQPDDAALLYLRSDTGLQRIGGASAGSTSNGVLDKTTTTFSVLVKSEETQGLRSGDYRWWLKGFDTDQSPPYGFTLVEGACIVEKAGLAAVA